MAEARPGGHAHRGRRGVCTCERDAQRGAGGEEQRNREKRDDERVRNGGRILMRAEDRIENSADDRDAE